MENFRQMEIRELIELTKKQIEELQSNTVSAVENQCYIIALHRIIEKLEDNLK